MVPGVELLLVMIGALCLTAFFRRWQWLEAGLVVLVAASAVSFLPFVPRFQLPPAAILGVVVPPLVYSAALRFSFLSFMRALRPILGLGVGLVLVTGVVVAFFVNWALAGLGLAAAFCLAAAVAPPDTVVMLNRAGAIGLTRKVTAILSGESLVNDAAALTLFAIAVAAVTQDQAFIGNPVLYFLYSSVVALLIGAVLGTATTLLRSRIGNPELEAGVNVLVPFACYFAAQAVQASGVLAVVMAGFSVGLNSIYDGQGGGLRGSPTAPLTRLAERQLWPVIDTLLSAFVFAYIGLQLRFLLMDTQVAGRPVILVTGLGVLVLVMAIRLGWVYTLFGAASWWRHLQAAIAPPTDENREKRLQRLRQQAERRGRPAASGDQWLAQVERNSDASRLSAKESLLVGWTGMRGIVTLAAAAAIPITVAGGRPFPHRPALQLIAFMVAAGTLLIQGTTLPAIGRALHIDTRAEDQRAAEQDQLAASLISSEGNFDTRRMAVMDAVRDGRLEDDAAREALHKLDLERAE